MITSSDLTPDRAFKDSLGDIRRVISVSEGRVHYRYWEAGSDEGFPQTLPVWKFLQHVNERT